MRLQARPAGGTRNCDLRCWPPGLVRIPFAIVAGVAIILVRVSASQKSDNALAAKLALFLEWTWAKAEDYGGDTALSKKNRAAFEDIDKAMDQFVELLKGASSAPDPAAIKNAFNSYMDELKQAD